MTLWSGMDIKDKLMMYINQPNKHEASILASMILFDMGSNEFMVDEGCKMLEIELDNIIYEKHEEMANWQSEKHKVVKAENRKEQRDIEDQATENYLHYLETTQQSNKEMMQKLIADKKRAETDLYDKLHPKGKKKKQ